MWPIFDVLLPPGNHQYHPSHSRHAFSSSADVSIVDAVGDFERVGVSELGSFRSVNEIYRNPSESRVAISKKAHTDQQRHS